MIINHPCLDSPPKRERDGGGAEQSDDEKMGMESRDEEIRGDQTERQRNVGRKGEEKVREMGLE